QKTGVTEIRFADSLHGWAFLPALWATSDGGRTWTRQSTYGRPTIALAGDAKGVYKVVSACPFNFMSITDCKHDASLWKTTPGGGPWTPVPLHLPKKIQALLAVHREVAYVGVFGVEVTEPDFLAATTDGQTWTRRPIPCDLTQDEHLASISAPTDTTVGLLCQSNIGFGQAEKRAFRSKDNALTPVSAGQLPVRGVTGSQIAMAPNRVLVVTSAGQENSVIYRNAGGQAWTTPVNSLDGAVGWNDPLFTTSQIGWVVHGMASCCG